MGKIISRSGLLISITLLLLTYVQAVNASDSFADWKSSNNILTQGIANTSSVTIGDKLYIIGGSNSDEVKDVYYFQLLSDGSIGNRNSNSAPLPDGSGPYWSSIVSTNSNTVLKIGGMNYSDGSGSTNKSFLAKINNSGSIDSWVSSQSLPKALSLGSAVVSGNYVYYFGGASWPSVTFSDSIYFAHINGDGSIDPWQLSNLSLPTPLAAQNAVSQGNKIYVLGGSTDTSFSGTNNVYVYLSDPATGELSRQQNEIATPINLRSSMSEIVDNTIFIAGGVVGGVSTDKVYYSTIDNFGNFSNWQESSHHLPKINCCTSISKWGSYIYIVGGHDNTSAYYNSIDYTNIGPLPTILPSPTPTPTPTPSLIPIVIIPGLGASWNADSLLHKNTSNPDITWSIAPYVKEYDALVNTFTNAGYKLNSNLFVYAYDWRREINQTAVYFNDFIENKIPPGTKIIIIGHSLGGLIGRIYAISHIGRINTLYTLGTPHQGTVSAYKILEGADFSDLKSWERVAVSLYLKVTQGDYSNSVEQVRNIYPVFNDLWPTFNFVKNNNSLHFSSLITTGFNPNITKTLNGTNIATARFIYVKPRSKLDIFLNRWIDGVPKNYDFGNGDGTILKSSSLVPNALINQEFPNVNHRDLPANTLVQKFLLTDLGLASTTSSIFQPNLDKAILVTVASPVNFTVTSPSGIYLPQDGLVLIDNPVQGIYTITINPIGLGGEYTLYFGRFDGSNVMWDKVNGYAIPGQTYIHKFSSKNTSFHDQIHKHLSHEKYIKVLNQIDELERINDNESFDIKLTAIFSKFNLDEEAKEILQQFRSQRFGN